MMSTDLGSSGVVDDVASSIIWIWSLIGFVALLGVITAAIKSSARCFRLGYGAGDAHSLNPSDLMNRSDDKIVVLPF
jgi:hypothetical protein